MAVIRLKEKKQLWIHLMIILAVIFAALLIFGAWFRKRYAIDPEKDVKVTIIGSSKRYTEEEIRDYVLDEWFERYSILIKWYYHYRSVEPLPFLSKIEVEVKDNQVFLTAYEKVPIGCILEMGNYLYFDSDGIIVSTKKENVEELPVITGLKYKNVTLYQAFETQKENMTAEVMNLMQQLQKCEVTAEEIHFNTDDSVVLYCDGNKIRLGKREFFDVPVSMLPGILSELKAKEKKYDIHMENVETQQDQFYATELEEENN